MRRFTARIVAISGVLVCTSVLSPCALAQSNALPVDVDPPARYFSPTQLPPAYMPPAKRPRVVQHELIEDPFEGLIPYAPPNTNHKRPPTDEIQAGPPPGPTAQQDICPPFSPFSPDPDYTNAPFDPTWEWDVYDGKWFNCTQHPWIELGRGLYRPGAHPAITRFLGPDKSHLANVSAVR